jgi:hypothetical protein
VQFAGFTDESVRYQDTQAFDLQSATWTDLTPSGALPQVRCLHTAAFDRTGRRMIVFGGQRNGPLGDFWSFDLQSRRWMALSTAQGPSPRYFSTSFVDMDGSFVLFGGTTASGNVNDTWVYRFDTGQWSRLETEAAPSRRSGMMGAYVESEGRFIIFGGSGSSLLNDVWELSRASTVEPLPIMPARTALVLANPVTDPTDVSFFFTDSEGQDSAAGSVTVPPNGQIAQFLNEARSTVRPHFRAP